MTRHRLPDTRPSVTHKVVIRDPAGNVSCYVTVGLDKAGRPREVFLHGDEDVRVYDSWCIEVSRVLQMDVPLWDIASKHAFTKRQPAGLTDNPAIPTAQSVPDYVCRWLVSRWGSDEERKQMGVGG